MSEPTAFPYDTRLNIQYGPLDDIDVPALVRACSVPWYNQTLCQVNDSVVRLGVVQGEYHWHKHDHEEEFFYKGIEHRPRAPERTVILMVEGAGIVPTGD